MSCMNFIILKVNGIDVSNFPHEEAVQLFLKAQEPIIVEVRRRTSDDTSKLSLFDEPPSSQQQLSSSLDNNKSLSSIACQTDISGASGVVATVCSGPEQAAILEGDDISSPQHCCHSDNQNIFNECLAPEIDIEEITLHKSRSDEKLGFTVSYSSGNGSASESGSDDDDEDEDTCADIYISGILPDSLAARDGRLRQGDQILQINGRDVSNKDETESLFAENKSAVTLLVSRCLYTDDEFLDSAVYCDDKEHNPGQSSCECEQNTFSSKSSKSNSDMTKNRLQPIVPIDTAVCDHFNHDKIKAQLESVNKEISLLNSQISNMKLQKVSTTTAAAAITTVCSKSSVATTIKNKKIENLSQQGGTKKIAVDQREPPKIPFIPPPTNNDVEHIYETIPEDSETDSYYCSPYESKDQSRVEQWLKSQGCTTGTNSGSGGTGLPGGGVGGGGGGGGGGGVSQTVPKNIKDLYLNHMTWNKICRNNSSGDDYENSSSAYNTGGSCNSNPLTFELKSDDKNQSSSTLVFRPYSRQMDTVDNCKQCQRYRKDKLSPKNKKLLTKATEVISTSTTTITSSAARSHHVVQSLPSGTMYTNVENLHQTIKLQQKLFRKALLRQNSAPQSRTTTNASSGGVGSGGGSGGGCGGSGSGGGGSGGGGNFVAPSLSQYQFVGSQQEHKAEQMVWKVKKRPDGSRYIVRRPVKNQLLQDRARRINEERNSMTTEDETVSEVKVGRYWTKDERKRHVEKSKERRQRQEMLISAKKNQTQQWLV